MGKAARVLICISLVFTPTVFADPPPIAYGIFTSVAKSVYPIDLTTVLRLAASDSPTIAIARARYREALARQDQAELLWLPTLGLGTNYLRHDGNTQNQRGEVFIVSRSNIFAGGAAQLRLDTADAYFLPLVARRVSQAESQLVRATNNTVQYDAVSAFLDLEFASAGEAIVADTLARDNQMLTRGEAAMAAGLSKTAADVNRARTEVNLRKQEALEFRGRVGAAGARLVRILALDTNTELSPADPFLVPVTLVPFDQNLDSMVLTAWVSRPEMAAQQAFVAAAQERLRQARLNPLFPKLQIDYSGGEFGGGRNNFIGQFDGRSDLVASAFWELKNLGFGNRAQVRERSAQLDQMAQQERAVRAQVASEVMEAARIAAARVASLDAAQTAVRESLEMYRKLLESSFGMVGPQAKYDPIEPLLAIQALHQARMQYLTQVIEFNRAQFRLFTALGQPAECALPGTTTPAVAVPVVPKPQPDK